MQGRQKSIVWVMILALTLGNLPLMAAGRGGNNRPVLDGPLAARSDVAELPPARPTTPKAVAPVTTETKTPAEATKPVSPKVSTKRPVTSPQATSAPTAKPAVKPAAKPTVKSKPKPANIRFQFDGVPYVTVVRRFAQLAGKPLIGDLNIEGKLTFNDPRPYTFTDAMDTLNLILAMKGYALREEGRFLRLRPLSEVAATTTILRGLANTEKMPSSEIVTVVLPVKFLNPTSAAKAVIRMVSAFGSITPLEAGKGVVITDTLGSIRRIKQLLDTLDVQNLAEKQFKTYTLKNASAKTVASILSQIFGRQSKKFVYDPATKRLVPSSATQSQTIQISYDERTNMLVLMGEGSALLQAEQMIATLDKAQGPDAGDMRIFALQNAKADTLALTVRSMLPRPKRGQADEARVVADAGSNRLIVSAPVDVMKKIGKLISDLDKASTQVDRTRIIRLQNADARSLERPILYACRKTDARGRGQYTVSVTSETKSNSLILSGPVSEIEKAEKIVAALDAKPGEQIKELHVVSLETGDARLIARSLVNLFRDKATKQNEQLFVEAESDTNSLIISATPKDWPKVQTLLRDLQKSAVEIKMPVTRVIPLKHAQAAELAAVLQQQMAARSSRSRSRRGGSSRVAGNGITISASRANNSLLVTAAKNDQETLAALIESLDRPARDLQPFVMVQLSSAKADDLAKKLTTMLPESRGRSPKVFIQPDTVTNTVLLRAPEEYRSVIESIIAKLDKETQKQARQMQVLKVDHVSAGSLVTILQQLYPINRRAKAEEQVILTAAPHDQAVIVEAPRSKMQPIVQLVKSLDAEGKSEKLEVRTYEIATGRASEVAQTLTRLFAAEAASRSRRGRGGQAVRSAQPQARFEANTATNQVLVAATAKQFVDIEALIAKLQASSKLASQTRTFKLEHAKAGEILPVLQSMLETSSASRRGRGGQTADIRLAELATANAIVIQAPPTQIALAEQLIKTFDTKQATERMTVQVVYLKNAQADTLARSVSTALADSNRSTSRNRRGGASTAAGVTVTAESNSNSVLVRGPVQDVANVVKMIQKLDAESTSEMLAVRVYPLKNSSAKELAANLSKMFRDLVASQKRSRSASSNVPFSVSADDRTNSLVVSTVPAYFVTIENMLKSLDGADKSLRDVEHITLQHADAAEVAVQLEDMFSNRTRKDRPVIQAEYESNAVTLIANDADLKLMLAVVTKLDKAAASNAIRIRVVPLDSVPAAKMAEMLKRIYGQMTKSEITITETLPQGKPQTPKAAKPAGKKPAATMATKPKADKPTVSIAVDSKANSLLLAGPRRELDEMESLIVQLSVGSTAKEAIYRVFPIRHGDPASMAKTLGTLLNQASATVTKTKKGTTTKKGTPSIVVVAEPRTRRLVVRAKPLDFEVIEPLIAQLDQAEDDKSYFVKVYPLQNALADSVAKSLASSYGSSAGSGKTKKPASSSDGSTQPRITAEASGNFLVVRATQGDHDKIAALVKTLDVSPLAKLPVQMIPLRNADPTQMAAMLNRLYAPGATGKSRGKVAGPKPVIIEADASARALMVRAEPKLYKEIMLMVRQLDTSATRGTATQTLIALKHAQADTVAASLSQAFQPARGKKISTDDLVTVVAEPNSNSLIVTANELNLKKVQALVAKLDSKNTSGIATEFVLLENAKAADLESVLSKVAGSDSRIWWDLTANQGVTVSAEPSSNALVLRGPAVEVAKLVQMAMHLDKAAHAAATGVYILPLANGDAVSVMAMIQDLYNQQVTAARRNRKQVDPLAVTADQRANAIVLATSKTMYDRVCQWVKQVESMKPARGTLRVLPLEYSDPTEIKNAIDQLYSQSSSSTAGRSGKVEVTVLEKQRAVMVNASQEDYKVISELVQRLETAASKSKRQTRIFTLANAPVLRVVSAIGTMYRVRGKVAADEQVTISAVQGSNAVLVAASKEKMTEIAGLIEQLDKKTVSAKLEFKIFPLQNAQPSKVLPMLRQMLTQIKRANPGETMDVAADERTRSIIVTARSTVFKQIETLIQTLDMAPAYATAEVLVLPLKKADAKNLAAVLNEMLRPGTAKQVTAEARALQEQVRRLRVKGVLKDNLPELDLTKPIKISADPARPQGSNSLILSSTADNLKALAAIVEVMDTVPVTAGVTVKLIHLKNADAATLATILRDVFKQGKKLAGKAGTTAAGKAEPETTTGQALVKELNVSADLRTNSLVLSGEEEVIALANVLIADLDRSDSKIVTAVELFRLKHADASRMAPILQAVFAEGKAVKGAEGIKTQVTRLKTHLDKKTPGKATEYPKNYPALTVRADAGTNILVIAARSDVMPLIRDVVKSMDIPGAGSLNTVRIFPLVHADASRLKTVISSLFTGPNAKLIRAEDKPTVSVDTRTNALIVSASEKTFSMVSMLLTRLDCKTPVEFRDMRLIALKNAEATTLAPTIQKTMDARVQRQQSLGVKDAEALRVLIAADARSNSLLVGGSPESFAIVKDISKQLDDANPALGGQVQLYPLKEGNAGTISATLGNLFKQRYDAARTKDVKRQQPIIMADVRTNSLLVAANADDTRILTGLLKKLDVKLTNAAVQLVVIPMKHNDAGVVGPEIERLFKARLTSMTPEGQKPNPQDRVDVGTDSLSNALIVSASRENLGLIHQLLGKVDVSPPSETGVVRMYVLKNSDAGRIATMLKELVSQGLYKPGAVAAKSSALKEREKVALTVDTRTNVLIVSASRENFAILEEVIRKLDTSKDFGLLGNVNVYLLKRADATKLAPTLQKFFDSKQKAEQTAGPTGKSLPVVIVPDGRVNALLVAGSRESFAAVKAMVARLDGDSSTPANTYEIFPLKEASASVLETMLQKLFDQRNDRDGKQTKVTILTETRNNSLIVGAAPEDMTTIRSLVAKLDKAMPSDKKAVHVFPLKKADATQTITTLRSLYQSQQGAKGEVQMSVDERINAILVSGGRRDVERIGSLIKQIDQDKVTRVTEIRVFPLKNADAEELSKLMMDVLTEKAKALTKTSPNRQTLLQFIRKMPKGEKLVTNALKEGLIITPDRRTNALVVSAPLENMPLLSNMIASLDAASPRAAEIRVFPLKNADATRMSEVLSQLFRSKEATGTGRKVPAVQYTLKEDKSGKAMLASATTGSADQASLNITVDVRTNSLLVGGSPQQLEMAAAVIRHLDSSPAQERVTKVYRPKNNQVQNIEKTLRAFLDEERKRLEGALGKDRLGAAQRLLDREVAVVAEQSSNTLLVAASPRYFETLARMIDELDQPPAQVLIQTLLAEVLLDDQTELGFEWSHVGSVNNSTITTGSNFNMQTGIGTSPPGFTVAVTGGDLNIFLRALRSRNRLEVLSRPQILAVDNQEASIEVGQKVPLITGSRVTDQNDTINTITYEKIGVELKVLPRIGSDDEISMEVEPSISSLGNTFLQVAQGVRAQSINNRSAKTTVTCYDGQTIIMGGLINTTENSVENKVPVLGDIPLVGLLFRSIEKEKNRNELMIFLTPKIIRSKATAHEITATEMKKDHLLHVLNADDRIKRGVIEGVQDKTLQKAVGIGADNDGERRKKEIQKTIIDLELLPQHIYNPGQPDHKTTAPVEKEVE